MDVDQLQLSITLDQCSTRTETRREYLNLKYVYLIPLFGLKPILLNILVTSVKEKRLQILMSN